MQLSISLCKNIAAAEMKTLWYRARVVNTTRLMQYGLGIREIQVWRVSQPRSIQPDAAYVVIAYEKKRNGQWKYEIKCQ